MKKTFYFFAVLFLATQFQSCKKNTNTVNDDQTNPQPKLQFTANSITYNFSAAWNSATNKWINIPYIGNAASDGFVLNGNDGLKSFIYLSSRNLLKLGSSTITISDCNIKGVSYNPNASGTIIISRISNGTADGTFNAILQPKATGTSTLNITDGQFSNIPVQ